MIQFAFGVVDYHSLAGKRKSAYRLDNKAPCFAASRCADDENMHIVRYAGDRLPELGAFIRNGNASVY